MATAHEVLGSVAAIPIRPAGPGLPNIEKVQARQARAYPILKRLRPGTGPAGPGLSPAPESFCIPYFIIYYSGCVILIGRLILIGQAPD